MSAHTVEVPELLLDALAREFGEEAVSRWTTEAMVVEAVREGLFTAGYASEILGLGYFDTLALLNRRKVPVELSDEDMAQDRRDLHRMFPGLSSG